MLRTCQFLTILTSKSLSRHSVVQILRSSTSKSGPNMQRGAFFRRNRSRATARGATFVGILGSRSSAPPRFSELTLRAFEATKLWKNLAFRTLPTHLCGKTFLLSNIDASRPGGNFQYRLKLDPKISFD